MSWEKIKLGKLYDVHNGLSKGRKFFGKGYPFLSFSTVFNNYFIPNELDELVQTNEKEQLNYSIRRGDVFVTRTSETSDELGMSCVALKDYPKATYNGFTKRLRPKTDKVLPEFIGYYMRMSSFRDEFQAFSTMTTRASLRNEELLSLEIHLPSLAEQTKIAEILSTYDTLIENNKKQISLLEEAAQRLYKEWFVDLHFPGYENIEIVEGLPEGWNITSVGELGLFLRGTTITKKDAKPGTIPVVAGGVMPAYFHNKSNTNCPVITISASGNAGYVNVYYSKIWASDCSYLDKTMSDYFYYIACSMKNRQIEIYSLQHGAAQQHVNANQINELKIFKPTKEIFSMFNEMVEPIFEDIAILEKKVDYLREARDRLLPKLMSGEINI